MAKAWQPTLPCITSGIDVRKFFARFAVSSAVHKRDLADLKALAKSRATRRERALAPERDYSP